MWRAAQFLCEFLRVPAHKIPAVFVAVRHATVEINLTRSCDTVLGLVFSASDLMIFLVWVLGIVLTPLLILLILIVEIQI